MEQKDETAALISAGKVQGTNVYNTEGDNLGEVYDVMIDKQSGKIAYAVISEVCPFLADCVEEVREQIGVRRAGPCHQPCRHRDRRHMRRRERCAWDLTRARCRAESIIQRGVDQIITARAAFLRPTTPLSIALPDDPTALHNRAALPLRGSPVWVQQATFAAPR